MPSQRRIGRPPKGDREKFSFAMPRDHKRQYEERAAAANMPLGDYLAVCLAEAHGFDKPDYVFPKRAHDDQGELAATG